MKAQVGFHIREVNHKIFVEATISLNEEKVKMRTGHELKSRRHWKRGMVTGSELYLFDIYQDLKRIKEEIESIEVQPYHTPKMIKSIYKGDYTMQSEMPFSILKAIEYACKEKRNELSEGTIDSYWSTYNVFTQWLDSKGIEDIPLNRLRRGHIKEFESWILEKNGTGKQSTPWKHGAVINVAINYVMRDFADDERMIVKNPAQGVIGRGNKNKRRLESHENHLTEEQVAQIEKMVIDDYLEGKGSLPKVPSEWYRQAALFQIYSGFSFVDLGHDKWDITTNMSGQEMITLFRGKNAQVSSIPVSPDLRRVMDNLEKHRQENNAQRIFPMEKFVNPEDYQDKDKTLYNREYANYRNFLKRLGNKIEPVHAFCSHTLRHTFAMIMLNVYGMSYEALSHMMGHSSTSQTEETYAYIRHDRVESEFFDRMKQFEEMKRNHSR